MKNSFEWKKDIDNKVIEKREQIARRNAQLRSISGMSLAVLLCLGCSVAVVRFSKINEPPVEGTGDSVTTLPSLTEAAGGTNLPSFTEGTYPTDTGVCDGTTGAENTEIPSYTGALPIDTEWVTGGRSESTEPIYTEVDPCPVTTGGDVFVTTTMNAHRLQIDEIINRAYPEKLHFPDATPYTKTFAMALEYYGLGDMNIAPSLRTDIVYRIDFDDNYTFLVDDSGGSIGIVVRDDITVNYVSDNPEVYYQLSMGRVTLPYDWVFTTFANKTFEYRGVEVKTGYINGNGISAELMVADYEYNGIKFRFTGHNVFEKEFISSLYNVIDCLFRK